MSVRLPDFVRLSTLQANCAEGVGRILFPEWCPGPSDGEDTIDERAKRNCLWPASSEPGRSVLCLLIEDNVTLYGVCVVVDEILQRPPRVMTLNYKHSPVRAPMSRFLVSAPRCYCILTQMPFFDLHFEVLNCVLAQERLDRITACVNELALAEQIPSPVGKPSCESEEEQSKEGSSGKELDPMFWMDFAIPVSSVLGAAAAAAGLISDCSSNLKRASTSSSTIGSPSGVLSLWSPKWWGTDSEKEKVDPHQMKCRWSFGSGGAVDGSPEEKDQRASRRRGEGDATVGKEKERRILWIGPRRNDAVHPVDEKEEKSSGSHADHGSSENVDSEATRRVQPSQNGSEGEKSDLQTCKGFATDASVECKETSAQCTERGSHQMREESAKNGAELATAEVSTSNRSAAGESQLDLREGQRTREESLWSAAAEGWHRECTKEESVRQSRDNCDASRVTIECASTTNMERSGNAGAMPGPVGRSADGEEGSTVLGGRCNEQPACAENGPTTKDQRGQEDGAAEAGERLRHLDNDTALCGTSAGQSREPESQDKGVGSGAVSAVGSESVDPRVGMSESMASRGGGITASAAPSANGMDQFDDRLSISSPEAVESPAAATPKMLSSPGPSRGLRSVRSAESLCSTDTYDSDEDSAVSDSGASDVDSGAGLAAAAAWAETLSDHVQQRPAAVAKEWKMPNFKIEKFDDYDKTDPLQWWMAFNAEADVHPTPELRRLDALYVQLIGGPQAFMTHMAVTLECTIATLHTKIMWEEFEKKWKTRFMVNNDKRHALNKIFRKFQGQQPSREWLTEWQRLVATPELNLPFDAIRAEFFAWSCDALTTALGSEFQYETFDDMISKARELIQVPPPSTDGGVAVVGLRSYLAKIDREHATQCGKSTSPYTQAQQEQMAALVKENRERKELLKQAKLKAITEEQAAKMKTLEEEMEEKKRAAEEAAAAEEAEEKDAGKQNGRVVARRMRMQRWRRRSASGYPIYHWGKMRRQLYVPQEEKAALARALATIEDPLERQETEEEKKLEWKLRMEREKKRRREEVNRLTTEVEKVRACRQEVQAQADVSAKMDKMLGYLEVLSEAWLEERQANWGHDVALNAMRSGFREFARDMVTHVGAEVRRLRDNVGKFCEGAIEGAKAVATVASEARPRKDPVKLKFPDAYGGKPEENFDNWESSVNRKFVRNFSTIATPLRRLLKKEAIWQWDKDCTSALKKLKRALIEYHVLKVADPSLPFVVTTDASRYGIGAVLQQDDDNGYKLVEFMSARMPSEKVATSTYEREFYALRQALEHWKHYLLGRHFKVYSDHETLRWLKTQGKMTPKLTRWAAEIDQFDFELKPVKGKYNVVADALSRRIDYFRAIVHYLDIGSDLQEKVRQAYAQDPIYSDLLKRVKGPPETESDYRTTEGLLFEKTNVVDRLCIPNSEEIRSLILGNAMIQRDTLANGVDSLRIICMYYQQTVPPRGGEMVFWPVEHLQPIRFRRPAAIPPHLVGPKLTDISRCKTKAEILEAQAAQMTAEEAMAVAQWATATLCRSLSVDNILAMLLAVLLEKQMVVICPNLGVLTAVVLSLIPMLRPYTWQSVLLPILPSDLIAFLDAPVPFVVGVQHKTTEVRAKSGNLIRVNVYKDQVKNPHSLPQLPRYRSLAAALQPFHEILASDKEASKRPVNKVTEQQISASEGFLQVLRAYLESLCADLPAHAITDVQSSERVSLLLKESFIDSFSYHHRPFIKLFVETQLFAVYTDAVLSSWHG
ncbi:hypothetical protein CBR_g39681 [Chara braunii]|uniref:UDENN domain-containing protein n=1 Tax=Chara braunii TaxID=69332 RepID=A0A388LS83_CHABU|nr:hypothetical protein CBR_g39681 [Chara braunii]|eukprot:GBG85115.1 hypothetical protein CBR_g39681 [Chara braunii]